jgi:hypothetical protein
MTRLVAVVLSLVLLVPALAEDQPCREDVARLCPDAELGGGALRECLTKNFAQLSTPCRERLQTLRQEFSGGTGTAGTGSGSAPDPMSACLRDAAMHCRGSSADPEEALACLESHKKDLSSGCRDALAKAGVQ